MSRVESDRSFRKLPYGMTGRNASGQLTYDRNDCEVSQYYSLRKYVARKYGLYPLGITISNGEVMFKTYFRGARLVGLEWDIWSGFIVVAKNPRAEEIVTEITSELSVKKLSEILG